jgi:hypothetical protein
MAMEVLQYYCGAQTAISQSEMSGEETPSDTSHLIKPLRAAENLSMEGILRGISFAISKAHVTTILYTTTWGA